MPDPLPSAGEADRVAAQLLAELRVIESGTGLPPMPGAVHGPAGRAAIITGAGLAVAVVLVGLSALVGLLF
jgi:hypothetical protein